METGEAKSRTSELWTEARCPHIAEQLGKGLSDAFHVDFQKSLIALPVEGILCNDDFPPEKPGKPTGVQIAALKWLFAETIQQRGHECRVCASRLQLAVGVTFSANQGYRPVRVRSANRELEIRAGLASGKAPMFQHNKNPHRQWNPARPATAKDRSAGAAASRPRTRSEFAARLFGNNRLLHRVIAHRCRASGKQSDQTEGDKGLEAIGHAFLLISAPDGFVPFRAGIHAPYVQLDVTITGFGSNGNMPSLQRGVVARKSQIGRNQWDAA